MPARAAVSRRATAALFGIMAPDDQIVAGARVMTGPPLWVDLLYAQPFAYVSLAASFVVRPAYIAVTRQRLIVLRLPRSRRRPARIVHNVAIAEVRVTISGRGQAPNAVVYGAPGLPDLGLTTLGKRRPDFETVLAALRSGTNLVSSSDRC